MQIIICNCLNSAGLHHNLLTGQSQKNTDTLYANMEACFRVVTYSHLSMVLRNIYLYPLLLNPRWCNKYLISGKTN